MKLTTRFITRSAIIAAIYAALTFILQPISFGPIQFRVAEAMTILPVFMPEAVPGLFIGCLTANLIGGAMLPDIIIGSLATLLAALCTRVLKNRFFPAALMPVLFNGLMVGPTVYFCYVMGADFFSLPILLSTALTVAVGEALVIFTLGLILKNTLRTLPSTK